MNLLRWVLALSFSATLVAQASSTDDYVSAQADYQRLQIFKSFTGISDLPRPLPDDPSNPGPPPNSPPPPQQPPYCGPRNSGVGECLRAACDQMSYFECNSADKMEEIACQCQGVRGDCVTEVCNNLSRFDCDERREVLSVINMCRGVDTSCIQYTCSRLGHFGCDSVDEMRKVTDICRK